MAIFVLFAGRDLYIIYLLNSISFYDLIKIVADMNLLVGFIRSVYFGYKDYSSNSDKENALSIFCFGLLLSIFIFILDWIKSQLDSTYLFLIILYTFCLFLIPYLLKEIDYYY